jgi:23S rRNA (uracil1939-C5)-methyltransferase
VKRGDEVRTVLQGFAEGKSVARLDGLVLFVRGGIPGDDVRVRLTRIRKNYLEGTVVDIITPSDMRMEPRCRYFGTCGGCTWQQLDYPAQLSFKRQLVSDALERIGGFHGVPVRTPIGSDNLFFYRNKMEFSFGERWLSPDELERSEQVDHFALGLHIPQRFDRVLDLEECWLQSEESYRIVNMVRTFCRERALTVYSTRTHTGYLRNLVVREGKNTGERMVNLVTSESRPDLMHELTASLLKRFPSLTTIINNVTQRKSGVAIGDTESVYHGPGFITELLGGNRYRISANSFFQTNTGQTENLYAAARRMADLRKEDVVFDLYSGTGTIALTIADAVRGVVGIESVSAAVEDARSNAEFNNVGNCTFVLGDLKDRLTGDASLRTHYGSPTVVIADPPRSGMHPHVLDEIIALAPERVVYLSCNPATQARDLLQLCSGGAYRIDEVQPVDMFPHTTHIENVVRLTNISR